MVIAVCHTSPGQIAALWKCLSEFAIRLVLHPLQHEPALAAAGLDTRLRPAAWSRLPGCSVRAIGPAGVGGKCCRISRSG
jgi:hypothetical protein